MSMWNSAAEGTEQMGDDCLHPRLNDQPVTLSSALYELWSLLRAGPAER